MPAARHPWSPMIDEDQEDPTADRTLAYTQGVHYGMNQPGTVENLKFLRKEASARGVDPDAFTQGVKDGAARAPAKPTAVSKGTAR